MAKPILVFSINCSSSGCRRTPSVF